MLKVKKIGIASLLGIMLMLSAVFVALPVSSGDRKQSAAAAFDGLSFYVPPMSDAKPVEFLMPEGGKIIDTGTNTPHINFSAGDEHEYGETGFWEAERLDTGVRTSPLSGVNVAAIFNDPSRLNPRRGIAYDPYAPDTNFVLHAKMVMNSVGAWDGGEAFIQMVLHGFSGANTHLGVNLYYNGDIAFEDYWGTNLTTQLYNVRYTPAQHGLFEIASGSNALGMILETVIVKNNGKYSAAVKYGDKTFELINDYTAVTRTNMPGPKPWFRLCRVNNSANAVTGTAYKIVGLYTYGLPYMGDAPFETPVMPSGGNLIPENSSQWDSSSNANFTDARGYSVSGGNGNFHAYGPRMRPAYTGYVNPAGKLLSIADATTVYAFTVQEWSFSAGSDNRMRVRLANDDASNPASVAGLIEFSAYSSGRVRLEITGTLGTHDFDFPNLFDFTNLQAVNNPSILNFIMVISAGKLSCSVNNFLICEDVQLQKTAAVLMQFNFTSNVAFVSDILHYVAQPKIAAITADKKEAGGVDIEFAGDYGVTGVSIDEIALNAVDYGYSASVLTIKQSGIVAMKLDLNNVSVITKSGVFVLTFNISDSREPEVLGSPSFSVNEQAEGDFVLVIRQFESDITGLVVNGADVDYLFANEILTVFRADMAAAVSGAVNSVTAVLKSDKGNVNFSISIIDILPITASGNLVSFDKKTPSDLNFTLSEGVADIAVVFNGALLDLSTDYTANAAAGTGTIKASALMGSPLGSVTIYFYTDKGAAPLSLNISDTRAAIISSSDTASFDKRIPAPIIFTFTMYADSFDKLQFGGADVSAADYAFTGNTITINSTYLMTLSAGTLQFTVFTQHGSVVVTVNLTDTRIPVAQTTSKTYDKNSGGGIGFDITMYGSSFTGLSRGGAPVDESAYSFNGSALSFSAGFLEGLAVGSHQFVFSTSNGNITFTLTVLDTRAPTSDFDGAEFDKNGGADVVIHIELYTSEFRALRRGADEVSSVNYTFANGILTIKADYLKGFDKGETIEFTVVSFAGTLTLEIKIVDSSVTTTEPPVNPPAGNGCKSNASALIASFTMLSFAVIIKKYRGV